MGQQVMIPIFEGAYLRGSDIGSSYPVNMRIETQPTGVDDFYLATEHGLLSAGTLEAPASGACYWGGFVYVIAGSTFYKIDSLGNKTVLATGVQGSGLARFDYSFDRLAFCGSSHAVPCGISGARESDHARGKALRSTRYIGFEQATSTREIPRVFEEHSLRASSDCHAAPVSWNQENFSLLACSSTQRWKMGV